MSDINEVKENVEPMRLGDVLNELTRPFAPEDIKWRVQSYSQNSGKALLVPYLDARHIQERLDEVVPGNWELRFRRETLEGPAYVAGHVVYASMTVCGITREDVGSSIISNNKYAKMTENGNYESLNENKLDPKTATSDSIKRVAAQFGIGRYLWNMDMPVWINAKGNDGKNKYQYSPPKYDDLDSKYHEYLYSLGIQAQQKGTSSSLDIVKYLLRQVHEKTITAEALLDFLDKQGSKAMLSIMSRMKNEEK